MKKLIIGSVIVLAILMLAGFATPVSAGVEPSPFQPEINKLGSIVNNLDSINTRVEFILGHPPDPVKPGLKGQVNRLEAMAGELGRLDNRMDGLIGEHPISPQKLPPELVVALGEVKASAQGIVDSINEYLRDPGTGDPGREFIGALGEVRDSAQQIVYSVNEYLYGESIY